MPTIQTTSCVNSAAEMLRSRREIDEAVAHGAQQPVMNVHAEEEQHHDALVESSENGGVCLGLRIENGDQGITHLNAENFARKLRRFKDQVGRNSHPYADEKFQEDQPGPGGKRLKLNVMTDGGKEEEGEGNDQYGFYAG